jgi:hypothetical protein
MDVKCMEENIKLVVGQTISYSDQANPHSEGIITRVMPKEAGTCFLLFGGKTSMEPITEDIEIIYTDGWHKSIIAGNSVRGPGYGGHRIVNKPLLTVDQINEIIKEYERQQPIKRAAAAKAEEDRQKQKDAEREQHKQKYPYLIKQTDSTLSGAALGAKNIRTELKRIYPDVKFSVTSEYYSMGCSIDVRWTDGPKTEDVNKIVNKYQEGHFDGMEDLYNYSDQVFTDVFGGAKYVCCQHKKTDDEPDVLESLRVV